MKHDNIPTAILGVGLFLGLLWVAFWIGVGGFVLWAGWKCVSGGFSICS